MEGAMGNEKTGEVPSTPGAAASPTDKPIVEQIIDVVVDSAAVIAKRAAKLGVRKVENAAKGSRVGKAAAAVARTAKAATKKTSTKKAKSVSKTGAAKKAASKKKPVKKAASKKKGVAAKR
jgi:hypothetical protein